MKKVVKRPVVVSTVSTAVVLGVAAVFVGRRVKQEKPSLQISSTTVEPSSIPLPSLVDIYGDDNDLGYC